MGTKNASHINNLCKKDVLLVSHTHTTAIQQISKTNTLQYDSSKRRTTTHYGLRPVGVSLHKNTLKHKSCEQKTTTTHYDRRTFGVVSQTRTETHTPKHVSCKQTTTKHISVVVLFALRCKHTHTHTHSLWNTTVLKEHQKQRTHLNTTIVNEQQLKHMTDAVWLPLRSTRAHWNTTVVNERHKQHIKFVVQSHGHTRNSRTALVHIPSYYHIFVYICNPLPSDSLPVHVYYHNLIAFPQHGALYNQFISFVYSLP